MRFQRERKPLFQSVSDQKSWGETRRDIRKVAQKAIRKCRWKLLTWIIPPHTWIPRAEARLCPSLATPVFSVLRTVNICKFNNLSLNWKYDTMGNQNRAKRASSPRPREPGTHFAAVSQEIGRLRQKEMCNYPKVTEWRRGAPTAQLSECSGGLAVTRIQPPNRLCADNNTSRWTRSGHHIKAH